MLFYSGTRKERQDMSEYIYEQPDKPAKVVRDGWNVRIEWDFKQREEIVHCRDCKHLVAHGAGCAYWDYCDVESIDGFCAWGERRES